MNRNSKTARQFGTVFKTSNVGVAYPTSQGANAHAYVNANMALMNEERVNPPYIPAESEGNSAPSIPGLPDVGAGVAHDKVAKVVKSVKLPFLLKSLPFTMDILIEDVDPSTGFTTCISPAQPSESQPQWIVWVSPDGSGQLYIGRDPGGGVIGDPIILPPNKVFKMVADGVWL